MFKKSLIAILAIIGLISGVATAKQFLIHKTES